MKNKKGWIRIVEAFMAILILLGFVMVILNQMNNSSKEKSILEKNNIKILRGIETNSTLRAEALSLKLPSYFNNSDSSTNFKKYFLSETLVGESCFLYFCELNNSCELQTKVSKNIYSSEILLYSNSFIYSPRKIKIFCYLE